MGEACRSRSPSLWSHAGDTIPFSLIPARNDYQLAVDLQHGRNSSVGDRISFRETDTVPMDRDQHRHDGGGVLFRTSEFEPWAADGYSRISAWRVHKRGCRHNGKRCQSLRHIESYGRHGDQHGRWIPRFDFGSACISRPSAYYTSRLGDNLLARICERFGLHPMELHSPNLVSCRIQHHQWHDDDLDTDPCGDFSSRTAQFAANMCARCRGYWNIACTAEKENGKEGCPSKGE